MRLLLDECVPRPLRREIRQHEVRTAQEMGWAGVKNGALLQRMQRAGFDALITIDQNLEYQQDLRDLDVAIVVLIAPSNKWRGLKPLVPGLVDALQDLRAGQVVHVESR